MISTTLHTLGVRRRAFAAACCLALAISGSACSDSDESGAVSDVWPDVDAHTDVAGDLTEGVDERCLFAADSDSDNDGLPDYLEDANRNCTWDEGETDWQNPDTDGDGIWDGEEDANGNGIWDEARGELNPRSADTDGDGIPDGREATRQVCTRSVASRVVDERIVLESSTTLFAHPLFERIEVLAGDVVYVSGRQADSGGLVFAMQDEGADEIGVSDVLAALTNSLAARHEVAFLGQRESLAVEQGVGRLAVYGATFALDDILTALRTVFPAFRNVSLPEEEPVEGEGWILQVFARDVGDRMQWSVAWSAMDAGDNWLLINHPRVLAPVAAAELVFHCEELSANQRDLDIVFSVPKLELLTEQLLVSLASSLELLRESRTMAGLTTRLFVVTAGAEGPVLSEPLPTGLVDTLFDAILDGGELPVPQDVSPEALWRERFTAQQQADRDLLTLSVVGQEAGLALEDEPLRGSASRGESDANQALNVVLVNPAGDEVCGANLPPAQDSLLETLLQEGGYVLNACEPETWNILEQVVFGPYRYAQYEGVSGKPVWGTGRLAQQAEEGEAVEPATSDVFFNVSDTGRISFSPDLPNTGAAGAISYTTWSEE